MSKTANEMENYIMNKIFLGEIKHGERVPSEKELQEKFGTSRTSARLVLENFKMLGIVHTSKTGKLILSPLYSANLVKKAEHLTDINETIVLPTKTKPPKELFSLLKIDEGLFEKYLSYVKIYLKNNDYHSFAISWINLEHVKEKIDLDYLKTNSILDYFKKTNDNDFRDIEKNEIVIMERVTNIERTTLNLEKNIVFIPTIYSVYKLRKNKIIQLRIYKIHPKHFRLEIIKKKFIDV